MKEGGVLEGFPVYLFGSGSSDSTTVIVDSRELGRLDLSPIPGGTEMNLIVAPDREQLRNSQRALKGQEGCNLHLVQADPGCYPFRDKSVGNIVNLGSGEQAAYQDPSIEVGSEARSADFDRILSPNGCVIEIRCGRANETIYQNHAVNQGYRNQSYLVNPTSGDHYFVTREDVPASDLLDQVHHGRLRSLKMKIRTLFGRGVRVASRNSAGVRIYYSGQCQTIIDRLAIISEEIEMDGSPIPTSSNGFGLFVKAGWNALLMGGNQGEMLAKLPLHDDVLETMVGNNKTLRELQTIGSPALHTVLPEVVRNGTVCDQAYWIEKRIKGTPATKLWWRPVSRRRAVTSGLRFLVDLHQETAKPVQIDHQIFDTLVSPHVACVEQRVKQGDPDFNLDTFYAALWSLFQGRNIPLVRTHGDFWQGNLLLSEDKMLAGVLDWDLSKATGWPLIDLLHLLTFQQKWLAVWHFGRLITWKLLPKRLTTWESALVNEYCSSLSIEADLWPGFVALYWLQRTAQVADLFDNPWFQRNVINLLPSITESLSSA